MKKIRAENLKLPQKTIKQWFYYRNRKLKLLSGPINKTQKKQRKKCASPQTNEISSSIRSQENNEEIYQSESQNNVKSEENTKKITIAPRTSESFSTNQTYINCQPPLSTFIRMPLLYNINQNPIYGIPQTNFLGNFIPINNVLSIANQQYLFIPAINQTQPLQTTTINGSPLCFLFNR